MTTTTHRRYQGTMLVLLLLGFQLSAPVIAEPADHDSSRDLGPGNNQASYSPPVREPTTRLYWGDTHLHTALSADSYITGTRLSPEQSYRFARGETVTADNGMQARLRRPLDFLAISDHAEYMGVYTGLEANHPSLANWRPGQRWSRLLGTGNFAELSREFADAVQSGAQQLRAPDDFYRSVWQAVATRADSYNEPGLFTAFIAYEWTSMITGDNLHRVVLYRDDADTTTEVLPYSAQDSSDPEDLWAALGRYEQASGGEVLAIAHNGNVSNGRMFSPTALSGEPLDEDYARMRARWEPVYEVTQVKGDGETHPALSPDDEFADFETWDQGNITLSKAKEPWMLRYEYARSALLEGLRHERELGVNPFRFGMIGSTDSHTGLSTASEDNFFGKFLESEPAPGRVSNKMAHQLQQSWELGASGLTAVWAEDNTRESLFAAIRRREVYATTGSRIQLRFFGGWDFSDDILSRPDYATLAYREGVPMGGELAGGKSGEAPRFLVLAARDPDGANLDRIQIIKGWLDTAGQPREKIYNVALSDERRVDPATGNAPALSGTVDLKQASYRNSQGAAQLAVEWRDPDFDASVAAFYYVRVLEIPTPRWTAHDARFFATEMATGIPMTVQDRAYSSPIWYSP